MVLRQCLTCPWEGEPVGSLGPRGQMSLLGVVGPTVCWQQGWLRVGGPWEYPQLSQCFPSPSSVFWRPCTRPDLRTHHMWYQISSPLGQQPRPVPIPKPTSPRARAGRDMDGGGQCVSSLSFP